MNLATAGTLGPELSGKQQQAALFRAFALPRHWPWLLAIFAAVALIMEIPYFLAYAQSVQGFVFSSMFWSPHDFAQYAATMREGASSASWLIHDHLTGEAHSPAFMYTLYVAIGKLAVTLNLDFQIVYHCVEVVARGVALVAIYVFCSTVLRNAKRASVATLLIVLSPGLPFLALPLRNILTALLGVEQAVSLVGDLNLPEFSSLILLITAPHLMLGMAFLLLAATFYLISWSNAGLKYALAGGLAVLGLGLTNSFSLVTLGAVIAGHLLLMWWRQRSLPLSAIISAGVMAVVAAPFLVYSLLVFGADPFWGVVYGKQNITPSPVLPVFIMSMAPLVFLALVGLRSFVKKATPAHWLVLTWVVLSLILMYAPVGFQRRFAFGVQPMMGVVAVWGLMSIWRWIRRRCEGQFALLRVLYTTVLALVLVFPAFIVLRTVTYNVTDPAHYVRVGTYHPTAVHDAAQWLARNMDADDVALAEARTANYIAGIVPGRVYAGHWSATLNYTHKEQAMGDFYLGQGDEASREHFLTTNGIRYVLYGPRERNLGPPPSDSCLKQIYTTEELSIYEVELNDRPR